MWKFICSKRFCTFTWFCVSLWTQWNTSDPSSWRYVPESVRYSHVEKIWSINSWMDKVKLNYWNLWWLRDCYEFNDYVTLSKRSQSFMQLHECCFAYLLSFGPVFLFYLIYIMFHFFLLWCYNVFLRPYFLSPQGIHFSVEHSPRPNADLSLLSNDIPIPTTNSSESLSDLDVEDTVIIGKTQDIDQTNQGPKKTKHMQCN